LVSGFFVCGFQLAFVTVHLPPYLAEHGITKEFAGLAMGLIGLFNVVGSYTAGILGSRNDKRFPLSAIYLLRAIATVLFISFPITQVSTLMFTAGLGFLWLSTVPFTMQLVIVMFGTRYMATLYGFVFLSHQIGSFLGVWLGGKLYDVFGSYNPVWWMSVGLGVFAFLVHLPIREAKAPAFAVA
jgi:predicted MFS family arabinose efflux permease